MNTANAIEPVDSGLWKARKRERFPMGMLWMIRCRHAFLSMDNIDSDVQNR